MVHVQLEKDWTDGTGVEHAAGASVDVDAATLAQLQADGVVAGDEVKAQGWMGPTREEPAAPEPTTDTKAQGWMGPTAPPKDTKADGWMGPTAPPAD
ncbi:hypothetical protein [Asanoa iriomotensis]|uniref:Uncharacterized protein n=1 Tax=Asanoa iriomotensis TaxID=234613 RepID=A0ABQ4BX68_9ACTN|nr:hypothetical protein [Asanoa iriomotensis]GIF55123.1 hypothetical protein Air01nite_12180 [Asanoa iriomotensis]